MLKSIGVNHINAFRSIETVDINRFNNAVIEKVNFNAPQLLDCKLEEREIDSFRSEIPTWPHHSEKDLRQALFPFAIKPRAATSTEKRNTLKVHDSSSTSGAHLLSSYSCLLSIFCSQGHVNSHTIISREFSLINSLIYNTPSTDPPGKS